MKLVTSQRMRELEHRSDAGGNTFAQMMERAGTLTAEAITDRVDVQGRSVLVLVGPGNNGGDGLVCARVLADRGGRVALYVWKRDLSRPDENWQECRGRQIPFDTADGDPDFARLKERLGETHILIDALLGTGVTRPVSGQLAELLTAVKHQMAGPHPSSDRVSPERRSPAEHRPLIVAVDLPSGLNPDTGALDPAAIPADLTVTFAFPKVGQILSPGAEAVGHLVIADIAIPHAWAGDILLDLATADEMGRLLPRRPANANKGTFGRAMVVAGSRDYVGAPALAGLAAGRVGAGLVTVAVPETVYTSLTSKLTETTFVTLPAEEGGLGASAVEILLPRLEGYEALLIGCGFGRARPALDFVRALFQSGGQLPPLVIDADALYALAQSGEWWKQVRTPILTPHPGEMARLVGHSVQQVQEDRLGIARDYASHWNAVVVLKGAHTVIAAPDGRLTVLPFANPALATAGTGDVLAGAIVGLVAQGLPPYEAACAGAYLHAYAGEKVRREVGPSGALAGDLLPRLPSALRELSLESP